MTCFCLALKRDPPPPQPIGGATELLLLLPTHNYKWALPFGPLLSAAATKMRRMKGEKNFAVYEIRGYHHNIIDGVPQTPLKTLV